MASHESVFLSIEAKALHIIVHDNVCVCQRVSNDVIQYADILLRVVKKEISGMCLGRLIFELTDRFK